MLNQFMKGGKWGDGGGIIGRNCSSSARFGSVFGEKLRRMWLFFFEGNINVFDYTDRTRYVVENCW
jgi:hypothetical protein